MTFACHTHPLPDHVWPPPARPQAFAAALAAIQMSAANLLGLPQADLQALLLYHVLPGAYNAASIPEAATALTTLA